MSATSRRSPRLPDFGKPPVAETVLSLQFEPLSDLNPVHLGLLWQRFRDQFPRVEQHGPLPPVLEKFEIPSPTQVEVTIEEKPPPVRVWFLNEARTELIQAQADRFIRNWRKVQGMEPYPRYLPIKAKFLSEVGIFEEFLKDERLGALSVNQCEVTYVNHIERSGMWNKHGQLEMVLRNWSALRGSSFLPEAEDGAIRLRFVIRDRDLEPVGRLHVALQPGWKKADNSPILLMNLTARGAPLGEGISGAFDFFDLGHEWIVKGFAELTTAEMHDAWERIDA
jgi:uncharacterized protein (TIGR04255 family)